MWVWSPPLQNQIPNTKWMRNTSTVFVFNFISRLCVASTGTIRPYERPYDHSHKFAVHRQFLYGASRKTGGWFVDAKMKNKAYLWKQQQQRQHWRRKGRERKRGRKKQTQQTEATAYSHQTNDYSENVHGTEKKAILRRIFCLSLYIHVIYVQCP